MLFLDLDLDFFLSNSTYRSGGSSGRPGSQYKSWSIPKVQRFLEERCGLSPDTLIQGRTVENHDEVFDFWRMLITSGNLRIPFEVIHVDAHPDLSVRSWLYLVSGFLYVDAKPDLKRLNREYIHCGNYLTFAMACGWVASLVWVHLRKNPKELPELAEVTESSLIPFRKRKGEYSTVRSLPLLQMKPGIPFQVLPWHKFKAKDSPDYIALSCSPEFTPPESDALIPVIEGYMRQI